MSLAMYASDYNNGPNNNPIQKKRENFKNKTLKRRDNHRSNAKVEAMLSKFMTMRMMMIVYYLIINHYHHRIPQELNV